MADKLIVARNVARLAPCSCCGRMGPTEEMALGGRLCGQCWQQASNERQWLAIPPSVLEIVQRWNAMALILGPHLGERGNLETPVLCLLRLLRELNVASEPIAELACCYCGELVTSVAVDCDPPTMVTLGDFADLYRCADSTACHQRIDERLTQELRAKQAEVAARPTPSGVVQ